MYSIQHLIGTKINRWTILEDLGTKKEQRIVRAICECGIVKDVLFKHIISGNSKSCGCLKVELQTKHGLNNKVLYNTWRNMIDRCYNIHNDKYDRYGAKGVRVCNEWRYNVHNFYNWALNNGWQDGLELDKDKLSNTKPGLLYCPEFCCFLTRKQNSWYREKSKIVTYNGMTMCLAELAYTLGLSYSTLQSRLKLGWSIEKAVITPIGHNNEFYKKIAS